ncbi:nucleoside-triphosphatase [Paenibacillus dendritiformis]|nr:nucleoside-triphosphatase [Paenibacillus dendritiformis]WGU97635.1 nucleoside-triphosphatase [Paenibacillus dendritiformis]
MNAPHYKLLSRLDGEHKNSKNAFLLTGKPRIGKTTMIKKLINEIGSDMCGGFYTEEITNSDDRVGFRCVSINGDCVEIANVESPSSTRMGRYGIDIENDEIGLMQMLSASFQKIVQDIVSDNRIVLGTISSDSHPEIDRFKYVKEVKIIGLNELNRDAISEFLGREILKALDTQV